jgi:excisionase family DNA binding protein
MSEALTVKEVAKRLKVNERTVYRLAKAGKLPGFKVAGAWRFLVEDIDGWIEQEKRAVVEGGRAT